MQKNVVFANARAKAKELSLLSDEKLHRMMECEVLSDAIRVLNESGYGKGVNVDVNNFYDIIAKEEDDVISFVKESAPKDSGIECFFIKNDYHNLKVLFKAKYTGTTNLDELLLPDGEMKFVELKEKFETGKMEFTNKYMNESYKEITKEFDTGNTSPRIIDITIDRYMFEHIKTIISNSKTDVYVKKYYMTLIDMTNLTSLIRVKKLNLNDQYFSSIFLSGGKLTQEDLLNTDGDLSKIQKLLDNKDYSYFANNLTDIDDLAKFETSKDEYLLKIFSDNKSDMFSVAPLVNYYLSKLAEIKTLRIMYVCLKNKVSIVEMQKRMRSLHA
ncbi:MAG: V-type ATPase subunit [Clostridia bacterium]|nr:V-type ATPase subunit [Clostridia bacterium]